MITTSLVINMDFITYYFINQKIIIKVINTYFIINYY